MISVIIPTHNRPSLLDEALSHIFQQKNVTMEVIVLNDVISDNLTRKVIEKYPGITYVEDGSFDGPSSKRKHGFKISQGEYIYTPDDDDYLTDDYFFSKCVSILDSDETLSFLSGNTTILYEYEDSSQNTLGEHLLNVQGRVSSIDYMQHFQEKYDKPISTVSTLFRRVSFENVEIDNIIEFSDSSIYLLSLIYGDAYILNSNVAVYRIKEEKNNMTFTASSTHVYNVLRQKEDIYKRIRLMLPKPREFWENQYFGIYNAAMMLNLSPRDKILICYWGIMHSHRSLKIIKRSIKSIAKILMKK